MNILIIDNAYEVGKNKITGRKKVKKWFLGVFRGF